MCAAVIPSLALKIVKQKKRGNLYLLPSYCLRLLALPIRCRTATQKPTPVYITCHAVGIPLTGQPAVGISVYTTGIYRCSILDI